MEQEFLIDSNAVIDYITGKLPLTGMEFMNEIVDNVPHVSVITEIEVLGFSMPPAATLLFYNFFSDSNVIPLSRPIVSKTIDLRKIYKIKLPDAIIAATALVQGLGIITRNESDFIKIDGLKVVNPYSV